jgi:YidC/Oxa1 family membrane protein insertase
MQDQNKNMIMAIALSLVVLLGWQMFFVAPQEEQARQQRAEQAQTAGEEGTRGSSDVGELPKLGEALVVEIPREQAIAESSRVQFVNAKIRGSINLTGGRLDDLVLSKFRETIAEDSPDVSLMSPVGTELPYFASFGWLLSDATIATPKSDTVWTANGSELSPGSPLDLSWDNGAGLVFHRTFALDENYLFTVNQSIQNNSDTTLEVAPYSLINRTGTPEVSQLYILHEGLVGVLGEKLREVDYDDLQDDGNQTFTSTGGWLGITDKYWLVSLMPENDATISAGFQFQRRNNQDVYQANLKHDSQTLSAGGKIDVTTRLFAGAKEISILDEYTEQYGIYNFDRAVDFGWFYYLTKPIFLLLQWIYGMIGNFGLSILILTVMVKALLFPLANKSYRSMAKMRLLQPKIEEIKKKVGDDRQKLQQEMMALYKQEGANPLAGCLPIVVQIPVFFALYKVFYVTIEMRHAPFFGWIQDMSAPDPTSILNLFGLLPYDVPTVGILAIFSIGIWPILMGISMYGQQLLNPQPTDPTQAQIMRFLPLIFTFILGGFAAGLVIYWTWNNLLSVAQQWIIMRGTKLSTPSERKKKKA